MYDNIFSMCTYFASEFESGQESKLMSVCLCYPGRGGVGVVPAYRWTGSGRKQNRYADGAWGRGRMRVRERERCWGAQVNQSNTKAITQWEHTHTLTAGAGVGWHGEGAGEKGKGKGERPKGEVTIHKWPVKYWRNPFRTKGPGQNFTGECDGQIFEYGIALPSSPAPF